MENSQFLAKKIWYKQWWGATIIVVSCILFSFIIALSLLVWRNYNLIKQGHGEELQKMIYAEKLIDPQTKLRKEELEKIERPFLGNAEAKNVIVEFIDFKCPVCKEQDAIIRQIIGKHGNQVKLILRNFPIETLYPGTTKLSEMSYCAHLQGLYWPAHEYLFLNQENLTQNLTAEDIDNFINNVGADSKKFNSCLVDNKTKIEVKKDYTAGYKYGISGTPAFFINGNKIEGSVPFENWEKLISAILNP